MGNTDCRGGLVDVLSTGTTASVGIHAQILVPDLHIHILFYIGHHIQRYKGRLTFSLCIKRGNTHKTMYTLLGFQITIGIRSVHLKGYGLDSCLITIQVIQYFN